MFDTCRTGPHEAHPPDAPRRLRVRGRERPGLRTGAEGAAGAVSARLEIVKCVCADVAGNVAVARAIAARHGRLDTVVTSAGTLAGPVRAADVSPGELEEHFYVRARCCCCRHPCPARVPKLTGSPG